MSNQKLKLTTPVGRYVGGSLYEGRTTNFDGDPLVWKSGDLKGQPRRDFGFAVAYPKTPGATHWAQEAWMKPIWDLGHARFPNGEAQRQDFAWKITDGDSTVPRKGKNGRPGRKPCEQEGYPGHWVVWFSGSQAPKIWNADGTEQIVEPGAVKPGYFVQVFGNVDDNIPSASPGLYINHTYVAFSGYGPEINFGPDVSEAGFGQAPLPPGASAAPVAGSFNPGAVPPPPGVGANVPPPPGANVPPPPPAAPVDPLVQAPGASHTIAQLRAANWTDDQIVAGGYATRVAPPLPPAGSVPPPPASAPTAVVPPPPPVTPNPAILAVPGANVPPPAAPARRLTAAAGGATYDQLIAKGWTDATLVQHGMMEP